ncbi:MAG: hypothetical protein R3Y35_04310 [Clostridia bacterium]
MSIFELVDNIFQLVITLGVGATACVLAFRKVTFLPFQYLTGASICFFTGTLYWTIYFIIYGDFPYYFSASELCYMCSYLFLIGLSSLIFKENKLEKLNLKQNLLSLILPVFVVIINSISFIMYGGLLWNLYYAVPLIILAYTSSKNVFVIKSKALFNFNLTVICFVIFNNMMFLVSCFGLNNLYVLFDIFLVLTFPTMLFFLKKESEL